MAMQPSSASKKPRRKVTFRLEAAGAESVSVVGQFNNRDPRRHPMKPDGQGRWRRALMLPEGRYEYKFLVDGQWIEDPDNQRQAPNPFGTCNNVVYVVPRRGKGSGQR